MIRGIRHLNFEEACKPHYLNQITQAVTVHCLLSPPTPADTAAFEAEHPGFSPDHRAWTSPPCQSGGGGQGWGLFPTGHTKSHFGIFALTVKGFRDSVRNAGRKRLTAQYSAVIG